MRLCWILCWISVEMYVGISVGMSVGIYVELSFWYLFVIEVGFVLEMYVGI